MNRSKSEPPHDDRFQHHPTDRPGVHRTVRFAQAALGRDLHREAVYSEAVVAGREAGGAKREVSAATWIKRIEVKDRLAVEVLLDEIDLGEAETIVLARELGADWMLMDEKKGRRKLTEMGLPKIGTVGILLKAKQVGLLMAIRPELEQLHQLGFSISQTVIDAVLRQADE